jgi:hypothetical protein
MDLGTPASRLESWRFGAMIIVNVRRAAAREFKDFLFGVLIFEDLAAVLRSRFSPHLPLPAP